MTRILCGIREIAAARVNEATPPLEAWYAAYPGEPTTAKVEQTLTMAPPVFWAMKTFAAPFVNRNILVRFVFSTALNSSASFPKASC